MSMTSALSLPDPAIGRKTRQEIPGTLTYLISLDLPSGRVLVFDC